MDLEVGAVAGVCRVHALGAFVAAEALLVVVLWGGDRRGNVRFKRDICFW